MAHTLLGPELSINGTLCLGTYHLHAHTMKSHEALDDIDGEHVKVMEINNGNCGPNLPSHEVVYSFSSRNIHN